MKHPHRAVGRIMRRTAIAADEHSIGFAAAAVAFWTALAVFPAVAVLVWLGGQLFDVADIRHVLRAATETLPDSARRIVERAVQASVDANPAERFASLPGPLGPLIGLLLTLWSVNVGMQALFHALDRIFEVAENRSWLRLTGVSLLFTLSALGILAGTIALAVFLPHLMPEIGQSNVQQLLHWAVLFAVFLIAVATLYRVAPAGGRGGWPFLTVGAGAATALLVLNCGLFSWFVGHFATLAATYGSLSTVVAFLLWLWSSVAILLGGAELDVAIQGETGLYSGAVATNST